MYTGGDHKSAYQNGSDETPGIILEMIGDEGTVVSPSLPAASLPPGYVQQPAPPQPAPLTSPNLNAGSAAPTAFHYVQTPAPKATYTYVQAKPKAGYTYVQTPGGKPQPSTRAAGWDAFKKEAESHPVQTVDPPKWNNSLDPLALPSATIDGDKNDSVKYVDNVRILHERFLVTIADVMMRRGIALDSEKVKAFYRYKLGRQVGDVLTAGEKERIDARKAEKVQLTKDKKRYFLPLAPESVPFLGADKAQHDQYPELIEEWTNSSLIWVCAFEKFEMKPFFFSNVGKLKHFHHSTFTGGKGVVCAGEWIVKNGRLLKISGNSGHYRPTINHLKRAVLELERAWQSETQVLLWNVAGGGKWEYVPVKTFAFALKGGYKSHPMSPD
jgi:hypothetical protein